MRRFMSLAILLLVLGLGGPAAFAQDAVPDAGQQAELDPVAARFAAIEALQEELEGLHRDRNQTSGEERALIVEQAAEKRAELGAEITALVQEITSGSAQSPEVIERAKKLLQRERKRISADLQTVDKALSTAKNEAAELTEPVQRSRAEEEIARLNTRIVGLLQQKLDNSKLRQQLGGDPSKDLAELDELLQSRARRLAALIESARSDRAALKERPTTSEDETKAKQRDIDLIDRRIDAAAINLRDVVAMMKARNLDTTTYQQLLIEATGRVTTDVFDKEVTVGLIESWVERGEDWVVQRAPQAFFALLLFGFILFMSWLLSRVLRRVVRRSVERTEMSVLAKDFVVRTSGRAVIAVGVLTGLSQLGIEMAPVLAGLGIAGFVVGFALQDTLSNFASGLMILVYTPFDVGDLIEVAGVRGTVDRMTLVSTSVLTLDNQQLIIPNNTIWNNVIRNVTAQDRRRVDFLFGIGYDDDIDRAMTVLRDIVSGIEHVDTEDEITIALHELGDSSVNFVVRVWTQTEHYWDVFWAINAEVKRRFDAEGISIPYPQRDVHIHQVAA